MNTTALFYFIFFVGIIIVVSWIKVKQKIIKHMTLEEHFLGKRNLGFILVGSMLLLTNINAAQLIGENESVYMNNMSVMAWGVTSVIAMIVVAEFFMPIYLRGAFVTIPDFLEARYDISTKKWVSIIFLISYIFNMLPAVLYSGSVALKGLFHFSTFLNTEDWSILWFIVGGIGLTGFLYTAFGGIHFIALSDVLLGICLFIVGISLPYFGLKYLGEGSLSEGMRLILSSKKEHFNAIGSSTDAVPFSTLFTGMLLVNLYYWGMEQYIIQRTLSSENLGESQKGIILAAFGKILYPILFNIAGIIALHLYPQINNTAEIFSQLVGDVLPSVLIGLTAAVIFGTAITGFNAGLNSISSLFVLNIYKPYKKQQQEPISEKKLIMVSKIVQLIATLIGMSIAPFIVFAKGGFYTYVQMVGGAFSVPIFTIIFVGFITKYVPPIAAKMGLFFFVSSYLCTQTLLDINLHYLHILALLFLITVVIMLLIGKFFPQEKPYIPVNKGVHNMKAWNQRFIFYAILLLLMILLYVFYSPLGILNPYWFS